MSTGTTNDQTLTQTQATGTNDSSNEPVVLETAMSAPCKAPKPRKTNVPKKSNEPVAQALACSAFTLFSHEERARLEADHPEASRSDVFMRLCEKWQAADSATKVQYVAKYIAKADASKLVSSTKSKKTKADPNAPKRACTTFILFSQDERASVKAENPSATSAQIFKRLGEKWNAADADTRARYAALYAENKPKAEEARRAYAEAPASNPKERVKADPNAPKRACSAFVLFYQAERTIVKACHPTARDSEVSRRIGEKWKASDSDTRAKYASLYSENKLKADEMRRAYADAKGAKPINHALGA